MERIEHYITEIKIEELRHLSNLTIELKKDKRTNLLLTGKNGSGKTTVLQALKKYLSAIADGQFSELNDSLLPNMRYFKEHMQLAVSEEKRYEAQKNYIIIADKIKKYKDGINLIFNSEDIIRWLFRSDTDRSRSDPSNGAELAEEGELKYL